MDKAKADNIEGALNTAGNFLRDGIRDNGNATRDAGCAIAFGLYCIALALVRCFAKGD